MSYRPFILVAVIATGVTAGVFFWTSKAVQPPKAPHLLMESGIIWYTEEASARQVAREVGKPLLVDFTADWCGACREMDELIFQNPDVERVLKDKFITVRLDVTESNPTTDALLEKYKVAALPAVVFSKPRGVPLVSPRILGLVPVSHFLATLNQISI